MTNQPSDRMPKTVPDVTQDQIERLRAIFPECVTEGQVDFDRLRATLGDAGALAGDAAYTFTWAGKADAFHAIQEPSGASLAPAPEESVNWDETEHLFIEGENLEVLKLLYKSYFGRVKMIYIDPPYNTGNDFIYRDDYSEPRRAYLEKTGQMDAEGNVLTTNPETSGRYHSDWLSMIYPRLGEKNLAPTRALSLLAPESPANKKGRIRPRRAYPASSCHPTIRARPTMACATCQGSSLSRPALSR